MHRLYLVFALILPKILTLKCSKVERWPQKQPNYPEGLGAPTMREFETHEQKHFILNNDIPPICEEATRILMYDTNNLMHMRGVKANVDAIKVDLEKVQATIIAFQRLPPLTEARRAQFELMLKNIGYKYLIASQNHHSMLFASKIPLHYSESKNAEIETLAVKAFADEGDMTLVSLSSTPLSTSDKELAVPEAAITDWLVILPVNSKIPIPEEYKLVDSPLREAQILTRNPATSVFHLLPAPAPKYTSWTGLVSSYLHIAPDFNQLCGVYSYHTTSTGRTPLFVDIGNCKHRAQPPWPVILLLFTILTVGILGRLFFKSLSTPDSSNV